MNIIVAVDSNWGIGYKGNLLEYLKGDLKNFRWLTQNKIVVFGRETLKTFSNQQPLKNRINVVLTRDISYNIENAAVVHSIDELFEFLKKYETNDVFIIGGESVYKQLLPNVDICYVTKIHKEYDADRFFPNLDEKNDWYKSNELATLTENNVSYSFNIYKRKNF